MNKPERRSNTEKENIRILDDLFVQRRDIYPKQISDGRYVAVYRPLTDRHLINHLKGEITLGTYILGKDNTTQFMVLDSDDEISFHYLYDISAKMSKRGMHPYVESSRRGGHFWFFFDRPITGKLARDFGQGFLAYHEIDDVEVYPKQDELTTGPGSLIRLPFGIHRKTGKWYSFCDMEGQPLGKTKKEQLLKLAQRVTIPQYVVDAYIPYAPKIEKRDLDIDEHGTRLERIKSVPLIDFISRYVELKETGSGAIGRCPFHDDNVPSFGVHEEGNFWNCFAGCGGGTIIDFWMKYKNVDFRQAVNELSEMLEVNNGN